MMNEVVQTIMTKNPISVSAHDSLNEVLQIFNTSRIHHLPVVNESNQLVGLITTYDLWSLNKGFNEYKDVKVGEVMSNRFLHVSPEDKVGTAAELFLDRRFHALPVVTDNGQLVGMVTTFDVLKYEFKKEYEKPILYKEILEDNLRAVV